MRPTTVEFKRKGFVEKFQISRFGENNPQFFLKGKFGLAKTHPSTGFTPQPFALSPIWQTNLGTVHTGSSTSSVTNSGLSTVSVFSSNISFRYSSIGAACRNFFTLSEPPERTICAPFLLKLRRGLLLSSTNRKSKKFWPNYSCCIMSRSEKLV